MLQEKKREQMSKENLYTPNSIRTHSGRYINLLDPDPDTIIITDIAFALTHIPRFGGHLPYFYSVAQHSIMGAELIADEHKFNFLLHDASEAFLLDIPKPLKDHLPQYQKIEENMMWVLAEKFGMTYPLHPEVKRMDKQLLEWEWNVLMLKNNRQYQKDPQDIFTQFINLFIQYRP